MAGLDKPITFALERLMFAGVPAPVVLKRPTQEQIPAA